MGNWEWDGQWSMDRIGWHAESGDTGSKTTVEINIFIYMKTQTPFSGICLKYKIAMGILKWELNPAILLDNY